VTLDDYLSVPPPRTTQLEKVKSMLAKQHAIDPSTVAGVDFEGGRFEKFM